eukprot:CAMPEP_0174246096 /NCGR_PEP_ID=MMETSP0417-20130205/41899_1 /TAXON_ID=242541 /ORGANISM="Mayorella sp, Strain BSH-02190019" /LENGTH=151 /DNA_ID=CAMNT_0015325947 /DNA_START=47 /DNA_END=502 /DNA_ORIENTATION=+
MSAKPNRSTLSELTHQNINMFKVVVKNAEGTPRTQAYYDDLLKIRPFCQIAYCGDVPASVLFSRPITTDSTTQVVIEELCTLPPFRRLGLGRELITYLKNDLMSKKENVQALSVSVSSSNEGAIAFFKALEFVEDSDASADGKIVLKYLRK